MMALPLAANAQAVTGLYIGGGLGGNYLQGESLKFSLPGTAASGTANSRIDPAAVLSLGWGFGNGLRAEIEASFRQNAFNGSSGFGHAVTSIGGTEQKAGGMANVLYDFTTVSPFVQPYIGAGIGYQDVEEQGLHVTGPGIAGTAPTNWRGSFAYQAILGLAVPIQQAPGLALTLEYRFMGLAGNRAYSAGAAGGTVTSTNDYNHSILVGFRYNFGQAPAAAPAPMPVADMGAKTFLVFFDWNKSDLTARSEGIVRDAATYSTRSSYTRIDVDGNADTSGTPGYNQGLSERRARVVAAELVRDGVPQTAIAMHAYGDTHLLVPTGPNTREPQNRRVEIVFH
jgi:outer membrane protein OmpA-like peptidoglycan-associated protein